MAEIVAYIKANKTLIDSITSSKVSVADIVNNLTSNVANKPLSAAQGVALKALIDAIEIPTKLSQLTDDSSHRTVTDAEKTLWNAKIGQSDLQDATDAALAQAKASGEFDGAPGKDGKDGKNGDNGVGISSINQTTSTVDGGSNVITITLSNGTTATFTVKNGGKGSAGEPGKTPEKGTDYFTPADKNEMVNAVIAALPKYNGGVG
jgi:hypothetical protein